MILKIYNCFKSKSIFTRKNIFINVNKKEYLLYALLGLTS